MNSERKEIPPPPPTRKLCLYGFGTTGAHVLQALRSKHINVEFIIDKKLAGRTINNIKIISLNDAAKKNLECYECVITLHNHYVDPKDIYDGLVNIGFGKVSSVFRIREILPTFNLKNGYWLDFDFEIDRSSEKILNAKNLFNDEISQDLFEEVMRYRRTGDLTQYPSPSLSDEYTPKDLPRFRNPLRLIDCGACTGAALRKFENSGYIFEKIMAFEPDPKNYEKLISNNTKAELKIFLPLATFSKDEMLSFESDCEMSSKLDSNGNVVVRASRIDSIQEGFNPNLMKFDVEGSEIDTLIGAETTIRNSRPNLCVAAYHRPADIYEIPLLINQWKLNYKFYLRLHEHHLFGLVLYCLQDHQII